VTKSKRSKSKRSKSNKKSNYDIENDGAEQADVEDGNELSGMEHPYQQSMEQVDREKNKYLHYHAVSGMDNLPRIRQPSPSK